MVLLQPKLNVRLSQKQVLTPGLVQMVSVLALNKLELRDMITAEMVENPVLEELEATVPLLDEVSRREEDRDRISAAATTEEARTEPQGETKDPFDEVDFGQYFQEYLDPGYRSRQEWEDVEKPSFENFLSRPATLTDHLMWQLSSMRLKEEVAEAAELVIGNLNEEGYLTATEDELMGVVAPEQEATRSDTNGKEEAASRLTSSELEGIWGDDRPAADHDIATASPHEKAEEISALQPAEQASPKHHANGEANSQPLHSSTNNLVRMPAPKPNFTVEQLREAIQVVQQMDPVGVAARDMRECGRRVYRDSFAIRARLLRPHRHRRAAWMAARRRALRYARDRGGMGMSGLAGRRAHADPRRELSGRMGLVRAAVGNAAAVHGDDRTPRRP